MNALDRDSLKLTMETMMMRRCKDNESDEGEVESENDDVESCGENGDRNPFEDY